MDDEKIKAEFEKLIKENELDNSLSLDTAAELKKPNVLRLNLSFPFKANNLRFWLPIDSPVSFGKASEQGFRLNSLPYNKTLYPDVYLLGSSNKPSFVANKLQAQSIYLLDEAELIIIPRLVETNNLGRPSRYYLEVFHQNPQIHLVIDQKTNNKNSFEYVFTASSLTKQ